MSRLQRLKSLIKEQGLDGLLITDQINLNYITGFTGTSGAALIVEEDRFFITDFRYVEQATEQVKDFDLVRADSGLLKKLVELLKDRGELKLGFDSTKFTVAEHQRLVEQLPNAVEAVAVSAPVEQLRLSKDSLELERIAAAADLIDDIYSWLLERGIVGHTERQIATEIEYQLRLRGAEGVSFPPIVAAGPHGALPHAEPRDVAIERDQLVVIDCGAKLDGYCSDCTRTFATGEPGDEARDVYELVLSAQEQALSTLAPGLSCSEADKTARDVIAEYGYGEYFGHSLGHGVGLEVHEAPRLATSSNELLGVGQVVTVEPGVYLPGRFGVRIEDLVAITENGFKVLSNFPKAFTSIN